MHEVDMTEALFVTIEDWWVSQPERPQIECVHLMVGDFTCVEPASLEFAFNARKQGTFLQEAELAIARVPFVAYCHTCQTEYSPAIGEQYACPTCQSPLEDIRSGRELKIDRLEWRAPVAMEVT
ncbi:MAG: hydrogenase maturation nickel metallochaperone HypA [Cyanobacteria bacterium J06642_2]